MDGGATWSDVSGPLIDVAYVAVHPTDPERAWALTSTIGLYRTIDGGATWQRASGIDGGTAENALAPSGLFVDPRNPDVLLAGAACGPAGFEFEFKNNSGIYKSTDGGATWTRPLDLPGTSRCVYEMSVDPFTPARLFVAGPYSDVGGRQESYDEGRTWYKPDGARPSLGVIFDPRSPFSHFGVTSRFGSAVVVSQDGGFSWRTVPGKLPAEARAISIDPERSRLFLGTTAGVFRSGNGGLVWAPTFAPDAIVNALAFGGSPGSLFDATRLGLFRVTNRGLGQSELIDLHDRATDIIEIAVDPSDDDVIYAAALNQRDTATARGQVFRSDDAGGSWQLLVGFDDLPYEDLTVDAAGTLYAASFSTHSLYRRGRDDSEWTTLRTSVFASDLIADPKTAGTLFLLHVGAERSRDSGKTWTRLGVSGNNMAIDPSDPRWVYVAGEDHLYRSSDGGDTWTDIQPPATPGRGSNGTRRLAVAPSNGEVIYRIGAHGGSPRPERSDDRGLTWKAAPLPNNRFATQMAVDPHDADSLWIGVAGYGAGLFHSTDGGATWNDVTGPFGISIMPGALRFDATGRLHVAYTNHGVWELTPGTPTPGR
jgi:photosystem II stability/assembly factor-like uncharacterized protein